MDEHMNDETLKRLLGPADRELLCDECFETLDEYVELELQGAEADDRIPGMRAHLEGCPACREDYDSLREFVRHDPQS
jgi:predicted anti-sigma-YlaC factor YlaD